MIKINCLNKYLKANFNIINEKVTITIISEKKNIYIIFN